MESKMEYDNQKSLVIDFNGQKMCIDEISRYTTCDDVIEMVFFKRPVNIDSYALFESSYGVERMLNGKESVLKVMRSWGTAWNSFSLLVRKVDNVSANMAVLSKARRKLRKIRSMNLSMENSTIRANLNESFQKGIKDKDVGNTASEDESDKFTKLGLLKRFLSDVVSQKKKHMNRKTSSQLTKRTPGDGCHDTERQCRPSPEEIANESEFLICRNSYLNAAFVEGDDDIVDSLSDTTDDNESVLDDESAFEDDSVCELERNIFEMSGLESDEDDEFDSSDNQSLFCDFDETVIKRERLIDVFRKAKPEGDEIVAEDDCMESFMNTLVYNSDSDEGMGSLDSDSE